ncbi:MAG TPA: hypothetical protein VFL57_12530, partial [Bryobacteraceae bacterium]|nr:hypothetical protein [Bryobacteraceae bacterium]
MTYLLLGTPELQLFAKSTTVLYGLLIILLFWSFGVRRKSDAGLFGGFLFAVLTFHYLGFEFLTWGYADLPLAFFAFLTFYAAYRNQVLLALVFSLG